MYIGETHTVLDDKGRITIPRRIRNTMDALGHALWYLARGFDGAIFMFPRQEWDKIRSQATHYSAMDSNAGDFRRLLFGSASEVRPDNQGRLPVAAHLRAYAGIEKAAVLIGVDDHLELWSEEVWQEFQESRQGEFKQMASQLFAPRNEAVSSAAVEG